MDNISTGMNDSSLIRWADKTILGEVDTGGRKGDSKDSKQGRKGDSKQGGDGNGGGGSGSDDSKKWGEGAVAGAEVPMQVKLSLFSDHGKRKLEAKQNVDEI